MALGRRGGRRVCLAGVPGRTHTAAALPADHTCDTWLNPENNETIIGYVPRLYNITRPTVPGWVYNATAKDS